MEQEVSLVVFEGGLVSGELETQMQWVRQGMVLDLIERARQGGYADIIVLTSYSQLQTELEKIGVKVVADQGLGEEPFHFGQRLWDVVEHYGLRKVLYMGGASAPLLSSSELKYLRELLEQNEDILLANNYYSADIVGFTPGQALGRISLPSIDNTLALALSNEGGLRWIPSQRSLGMNFDVDTPTDLLI